MDKGWRPFLAYATLGSGTLAAWNTLITTSDFFQQQYPDRHVDRLFAVCYLPVDLAVTGAMLHFHSALPLRPRAIIGFSGMLASLALVVIAGVLLPPSGHALATVLVAVGLSGCFEAVAAPALWAQAAKGPPLQTHALVAGTAWSGLAACLLRLLVEAVVSKSDAGLRASAQATYSLTLVWLAVCLGLYLRMHPAGPRALRSAHASDGALDGMGLEDAKSEHRDSVELVLTHELGFDGRSPGVGRLASSTEQAIYSEDDPDVEPWETRGLVPGSELGATEPAGLWRRIWKLCLATALVYVVTLSIFPGVVVEGVPETASGKGSWTIIWLVTAFNAGDLVGKMIPALVPALQTAQNQTAILVAVIARLAFVPAFFFSVGHVGLLLLCTLGLAVTNGALTAIAMASAPPLVAPAARERAGSAMVLSLVAGLAIGAALSFLWLLKPH